MLNLKYKSYKSLVELFQDMHFLVKVKIAAMIYFFHLQEQLTCYRKLDFPQNIFLCTLHVEVTALTTRISHNIPVDKLKFK